MNFGPTELIILAVIVLVLFGGAKLPQAGPLAGPGPQRVPAGLADGDRADGADPAVTPGP